ncbi:hypothetical protein SISSUDRAFT_371604 [Sistotremastrum suecicum HHB10207 ss-3]|uniref:PUB domain-containing protein n=1 Tax=Sistotremastrum suecicum HHB10207 ss-3 TaxID=1314776 RepID=A0A166FZE8_9AGAM|nr:hypothetical protein SISSUDRAFT_371604 [Sistotremastrum suecicum HHB10207 ss-3]
MSLNTPESNVASSSVPRNAVLTAVERRLEGTSHEDIDELQFGKERDMRQHFRRLLDPGIMRPNSRETAIASLQILRTIASNLLKEPQNPKFCRFKPTNATIKKNLVEVPGALEYAIAMGFSPEVEDFQPYYVHNKRRFLELRIGESILAEALTRITSTLERDARSKASEKAEQLRAAEQVRKNFEDDRKQKQLRDKMEKEARVAKAEAARRQELALASFASPEPSTGSASPPGGFLSLQGGRMLADPAGVGHPNSDPSPSADSDSEMHSGPEV